MLQRLWRRNSRDDELRAELETYLEHEIEARVREGMSEPDARAAAMRKLGNATRVRETVYESASLGWLESFVKDLRYGLRMLRRSPAFACSAIVSLTLGIGANTAIFQLLDALRLRSLPVANPADLAEIRVAGGNRGMGVSYGAQADMTAPLYDAFAREQHAFSSVFAWAPDDYHVGRLPDRQPVRGIVVTGTAFPTLGVSAFRGRLLTPDDDTRGCRGGAVVLSYAFWLRQYGGRDDVIGRAIVVDDHTFEIAGVTPPEFLGLEVGKTFDIALPLCTQGIDDPSFFEERNRWSLVTMGRLARGWTIRRAAEHVGGLSPGLFAEVLPSGYDPSTLKRWSSLVLTVVPAGHGVSQWRDDYEESLWLLLAITGLVLLIACANLASLLLARASAREREFALRGAIGASRGRLLSQALTESAIVAALGAALGGVLAGMLSRALVAFVSTQGNPLILDLSMDWRGLAFTAAAATLTCLACGLVPAWRSSRTAPGAVLKAGGRSLTDAPQGFSFQRLLVVFQVAVSLVLIVGALLFVRSFRNLTSVDVGLATEQLYVAVTGFPRPNQTPQSIQQLRQDLLEHIRALPDVEAAGTTTVLPLSGMSWTHTVHVPAAHGEHTGPSKFTWVSPGYFDAVAMTVLRGRRFDDRDTASSRGVMLVNETFVRRYLDPAKAIGTIVRTSAEPNYPALDREIIGIVHDSKYGSLRDEVPASAYVPVSQHPSPQPWAFIMMRSAASLPQLSRELTNVYSAVGITTDTVIWPMRDQIRDGLIRDRLMSWLSGFFGLLAALLSAVGLYGIVAYATARRSNEIAIRMALGAERGHVLRLMLAQAARLLAIGVAIGTLVALALGRSVAALLFGIVPDDTLTLATAAAALVAVGLTAAYLPTARAARMSPLDNLRAE